MGYEIYRSGTAFTDPDQAVKVNAAPLAGNRYTDLPVPDGSYHYRVVAVNALGTASAASNEASAVADSVAPKAQAIDYAPQGSVDESGRMAPGPVSVSVQVSEPLMTTPFLSISPDGGLPITVDLSPASETTYTGRFDITETTKSGTAYAVFSARDRAGNRGTEVERGATLAIDTAGPSVVRLVTEPVAPIRADEASPSEVHFEIELDQPVRQGSVPQLAYRLSGEGRSEVPLELSAVSEVIWRGRFTLPGDAGGVGVETLSFVFEAVDDLGNRSDRITAANRFQVYQGELPPLATPAGLSAEARPGGAVELNWEPVNGAGEYLLYRQAPGEAELTRYQRSELAPWNDSVGDGTYRYAVASVRQENGQEALSALSESVSVEADGTAPPAPQHLTLELVGSGVKALWQAPEGLDEPVTYNLYRTGGTALGDLSGLSPVQSHIVANDQGRLGFIDTRPDENEPTYAVTAVDNAGNESAPSDSVYLNVDLLPVASLEVSLDGEAYPVVRWSHGGQNIAGYNLVLDDGTEPVNEALLSDMHFTDSGYTGGERRYTVTAVDLNGKHSVGRSVTLPAIEAALPQSAPLKRGIFNQLDYTVTHSGTEALSGIDVQATLGGRTHHSAPLELAPGASARAPVVVGGFADLPGVVTLTSRVVFDAPTGERSEIVRHEERTVGDSALVLGVQTRELTRGTAGQVRFTLENTSAVATEIVTARDSGRSASDEIRVHLLDGDGNVLSSVPFKQALGEGVITLANRTSIARVPPGEAFTSAWLDLPIPSGAPDAVSVELAIERLHYHLGRSDHVAIEGLRSGREAVLADTAYAATVDTVSPSDSWGDEPIVIEGRALARDGGEALSGVPVKLVIAVKGFERQTEVFTDEAGRYRYTFTPLAGESGVFSISAIHPQVLSRPGQGSFTLRKLTINPDVFKLRLAYNVEETFDALRVTSGEGTTATNLRLIYEATEQPTGILAEALSVRLPEPLTLGPQRSTRLPFSIVGASAAEPSGTLVLKLVSDERVHGEVRVHYELSEARPALYASPHYIETGVSLEGSVSEALTLENRGLAPLNDVTVSLLGSDGTEAPGWIYLSSPGAQGSLAVGEKRQVSFTAAPDGAVAEGIYPFVLRVSASNHPVREINLFVAVTRSGKGNVLFKASDIYTATLDESGKPIAGLSGARIHVQNEEVLSVERTLSTDAYGEALFEGLPAGRYRFRASASNHQDTLGRFSIKPGITTSEAVFLDYNLVTVEWSVTEITLEDSYEVSLQATYETDVPAAVVVVEPSSTSLPAMAPGDVFHGELRLTNYGLIRADNLTFELPGEDAYFRYEFQQGLPAQLEAKQSLVIPYRVVAVAPLEPDGSGSGGGCGSYLQSMKVTYEYDCSNGSTTRGASGHSWTTPIDSSCSNGSGGTVASDPVTYFGGGSGGGSYGGSWSGGGSGYSSIPGAQCIPKPPECPVCEALKQGAGSG